MKLFYVTSSDILKSACYTNTTTTTTVPFIQIQLQLQQCLFIQIQLRLQQCLLHKYNYNYNSAFYINTTTTTTVPFKQLQLQRQHSFSSKMCWCCANNKDHQRMMVDPMLMIVQNLGFQTAVTPTAVVLWCYTVLGL